MTTYTHQTAPTQFVEANGIRFAYRRFGRDPDCDRLLGDGADPQYWSELNDSIGAVPLVLNQHFTGTMDHWDPAVTDGLAKDREVILFNNAGVSSSSGEVPTTVEEMGGNAIAFIKALGLKQVDVLGFSIGGFVAQEITLQAPERVRRLVLVGTGPRGGQNMATLTSSKFSKEGYAVLQSLALPARSHIPSCRQCLKRACRSSRSCLSADSSHRPLYHAP